MRVHNEHVRVLPGHVADLGHLLDRVAAEDSALWPRQWPKLKLDRGLAVGARGGHGPIRYSVVAYEPGRRVTFRFERPRGFHGTHTFALEPSGDATLFRHVLEMDAEGAARVAWPLVFAPLHDALIEDAFDAAERAVTGAVLRPQRWSLRVRALRRVLRPRVDTRKPA